VKEYEKSFIAIKPDGVQRCLIGEIIQRFERKGLKLCAIKMLIPKMETVTMHYSDLQHAPFFRDLVDFYCSGPVVATVWEGENAIAISRKLVGKTHPEDSEPGSIRGDYCIGKGRNLVHASDNIISAKREIGIWFQPEELIQYSKVIESSTYAPL
jgi:nucleoside-diphosphate kinase